MQLRASVLVTFSNLTTSQSAMLDNLSLPRSMENLVDNISGGKSIDLINGKN